jgi:hypothetical protein
MSEEPADRRDEARCVALDLLSRRAVDATICPSEVARALAAQAGAPSDWRAEMPIVHAAVDAMIAEGRVRVSWKGQDLVAPIGPYRIRAS